MSMKAELSFPQELVDQICDKVSDRVIEKLKTLLVETINNNDDKYLTTDEVSKLLKVSKEQIYQWVSNSRHGLSNFPYKKPGKQLRFSKRELIEFMELRAK